MVLFRLPPEAASPVILASVRVEIGFDITDSTRPQILLWARIGEGQPYSPS